MNRTIASILTLMILLSLGTVLLIAGCERKPQSILIAAPVGPADGPLYIANEKGYLEEEGLNATLVPMQLL
jgi:ABC-type nitrate/sulfonate/bicarbonate transport system substrate-binding protein